MVNVREEVIEYINGHPVEVRRVEVENDESDYEPEEADVEEKRARGEGNDGG